MKRTPRNAAISQGAVRAATLPRPWRPALSRTAGNPSLWDGDFFLRFIFRGRRWRQRSSGLWMARPAILVEEVIEPCARALERTIRRWNVNLEQVQFIRGFRTIVHLDPDT